MPPEQFKGNETQGVQDGTVPGQEQPPSNETRYVTADELNAVKKEYDERLKNLYRGVQSQSDKLANRVEQRMEMYEKAAQLQGATLTDSQKQLLRDQTTLEELRATSSGATPNESTDLGQRKGESDQEFSNRINLVAETLMQLEGITFDDTDPEIELINKAADKGTAKEYIEAHREAIRLKKERLSNTNPGTPEGTPAAKVPGAIPVTGKTNALDNMSLDQLWSEAKKKSGI